VYEAQLAERQYRAVDPDNRLVTAELERRWELALRNVAAAEEAAERAAQELPEPILDPALRRHLSDLGREMPALWASGRLRPEQQKELLRCLIRRVILTRPVPEQVEIKIVWLSGAVSLLSIRPRLLRTGSLSTYPEFVARVLALAAEGHLDADIAQLLSEEGFRSARSPGIPVTLVRRVRRLNGQPSLFEQSRRQAKLGDAWTVWGLAQRLGVDRDWLYRRLNAGRIPAKRHPLTGQYLIEDDLTLIATLQEEIEGRHPRVKHVEAAGEGGHPDA
jgi:hypothetical protein